MRVDPSSTLLITGASSGIGAALAVAAGELGATVAVVARRGERLDAVIAAALAAGAGETSRAFVYDLSDPTAAAEIARRIDDEMSAHGRPIDVLVNNAAIPKRRYVDLITQIEVEETMRVNFTSPVAMTLALLPRMLERGCGCIVNVASMGGRVGILQEAAYSASKFALTGWSESMAADLWHTCVDIRLVHPGPVDTEIWDQPGNDPAHYDGELEPPSTVAKAILDAIEGDRFETYSPDLSSIVEWKTANIDEFIAGIAAQRPT